MEENKTFEVINPITKKVWRYSTAKEVIAHLDSAPKDRSDLNNIDCLYILAIIGNGIDKEVYFPGEFREEHQSQ